MRFLKSITGSLIITILIVLLIGQGVLWAWFLYSYKNYSARTLEDNIKNTSLILSDFASQAITENNFDSLDRYIEGLSKDENLLSIKVFDKNNSLIRGKNIRIEQKPESLNPFYIPWENRLTMPIKSGPDEVGRLEIVYSGTKTNEAMLRLLTLPPIGQVIVFLVMIYVIYFFFQRKIGTPVKNLRESIRQVTKGDLSFEVPEISEIELGTIANGLKFLTEGLSSTVKKLRDTTDNVAMAIRQLNLTFNNVSKGMERQSQSVNEISQSLKKANEAQKKITDSTEKLSEFSSENVTSLLELKTIADEIASSANKLFEASENSYSTVSELSQTAKVVAESAEKVQTSVEDALASVEEISASVKEVESSAKESTALAANVREIAAERGVLTVSDAIDGMEKISDNVKYSAEIVRRLGSRSKDIEKMLSVIKEVTEQTNLLSLNAAILAAQAGEYGKGFSVVSEEIRALSDRTAASTKEIKSIVSTIQAEINEAVVSIENGIQFVEEGSALVYKAGESMGSILDAAQKSVQMAKAIEKATEEQAGGLKQISRSIDDIRKMVTHMTKASAEQLKASEFMLERIGEVKEIAESTKKGTSEQATGTRVISKNLELAGEKVIEITHAALNQQKLNEGIISAIDQIRAIGASILSDMEAVTLSLSSLEDEMNNLKKEMETFKVR